MSQNIVRSRYCYDHRGNVTWRLWTDHQSREHVTAWTWTLGDRMQSMTYPSGAVVHYTRDSLGRVTGIFRQQGSTQVLVSAAGYLPFGPLSSLTLGNSETQQPNWTRDYWISSIVGSDLSLSYTQDANGNIVRTDQVTGGASEGQYYVYDDLQRLTQVQALDTSPIDRWTYDRTGNRLSHTTGASAAVVCRVFGDWDCVSVQALPV